MHLTDANRNEFNDYLIRFIRDHVCERKAIDVAQIHDRLEANRTFRTVLMRWGHTIDSYNERRECALERIVYGYDRDGTRPYSDELERNWYEGWQAEVEREESITLVNLIRDILVDVYDI